MNELEVRNQIRRTDEEAIEIGTMEEALLQDQGPEIETMVTATTEPSGTGVWFRSLVASCLSCRSGDEPADGGHMIVPSIGQAM